jgi:molybdenum cofactor cytidylyltransferase
MLSIIVLAAGLSSRMRGAHKLLLPYQEKTVIWHTMAQIHAAMRENDYIQEIIVVTGHNSEAVQAILEDYNIQPIYNAEYAKGMTTSIQAGVRAANIAARGYMICLSDQPHITAAEYNILAKSFEKENAKAIIMPTFHGERGNPVLFPALLKSEILENTEMTGCKPIVQRNKSQIHLVEMPTNHILLDIDTPEDYSKVLCEML